jgi:FHA domain-containing protein
MHLVIRAHTLKGETLSQAITGHFDERGGTIGRSDTNTLSLPDPERHISRLQAEVWFSNGGFSIRNVGSANAITVNGRPISPGEGTALGDGDEIVVGSYGMRAALGDAAEPATQIAPVDARTVIKSSVTEGKTNPRPRSALGGSTLGPTTSASNPFADLLGSAVKPGADDPFAGLMGGAPANPPTTAVHVRTPVTPPPVPAPPTAPPPAPVAARLPDDFDPFADLAPPPASPAQAGLAGFMAGAPAAPPPSGALPADLGLGDLIGSPPAQASSLDAMFGLNAAPAPGKDPLAAFLSTPASSAPGAAPENKDPMAMFGTPAAAPAPAAPPASNHTPELRAAYVPPAVQEARPVPKPVPAPAPAASIFKTPPPPAAAGRRPDPETVPGVKPSRLVFDSAHAPLDEIPPAAAPAPLAATPAQAPSAPPDALWAAFCEGAGVNIKLPQGLTPEMMKIIGQVMHHAIDGTIRLVHVRAAAKQEMKADVTTIQARNNNPLKFSPDAGVAIEQLLQPPMRGFMMGPVAVNDVMDDLLGHAIGTMAGMRAALGGVLDKFEPGKLENKLAGNSVLDSVLPMNRRAKLWELYLQHYKRIREDAQEDFHDLFGKAFIEAYEEQLDRLDAARHPSV